LRSQTLSVMHEAVHAGEIPADGALDRLTRTRAMSIRLLGDAVLRAGSLARSLFRGIGDARRSCDGGNECPEPPS